MGSDNPTVVDTGTDAATEVSSVPERVASTSGGGRDHTTTTQLPRPETVLQEAEIEQTRRMAITGVVFNVIAIVSSPFIGGEPTARIIVLVSLSLAACNNIWLWYISSDERRYDQNKVTVYFVAAPILNLGIIYFLGVFGPILVMFVLNIYTACLGYERRIALVTLWGSVIPYLLIGTPIALGWLPDPGLMSATPYIGVIGRTLVVVSFSLFLFLVYAQARRTREVMVASLTQRDEAVRRASHREALFLEARQDLERAIHAGGLGRFTDQTLGSFKLGVVIGRGGMGEVYEATHVSDGRHAAVKMLLPEVLARPNYVRRFLREVRIAASLDSPHVVQVLEVGDESAALPYLAMERLEGEDLAQILRREERLAPARVVDLIRQVGEGLGVAAAAGIVHRDLKPQNLFLTEGEPGLWKILDFGVSKLAESGGTLTQGEAIGTPQYMAPEQARGAEVAPAADMYGLGAIAYRALTGHQPFRGRELGEVLLRVVASMPVRPSALVKFPRDVDLVLALAIAKNPADRFETGEQFADALEAALAGHLDTSLRGRAWRLLETLPWQEPSLAPRRSRPSAD